ncbi:MAG: maltotransferase domain-containing protein [Stellaceae bacterium]
MRDGLRIYNLFPTLAGTIRQWAEHLPRIASMGFNAVYLNPFHFPGFSGSLYAVKDYYRLNPRLRDGESSDDDSLLAGFAAAARQHGLRVIMDLVLNHTSKDSELVRRHPDWFAHDATGAILAPSASDPADPRRKTEWGDLAELDYRGPRRDDIAAYFEAVVGHYLGLGFGGFRCDAAYKVPTEIWRTLTDAAKTAMPDALFCAETVGAPKEAVLALAGAGFDYLYNSVKWWDFKSPWLLDQYESFRHIAPSIGFPESHDTPRLVTELRAAGVPEIEIEPRYRQAYAFAAAYSAGVLMPMGFEFGWERRLPVVMSGDEPPEPKRFDLSRFIAEVNAEKSAVPPLNEEGPQRLLPSGQDGLIVLERRAASTDDRALILVNRDPRQPRVFEGALAPYPVAVEPLAVRVVRLSANVKPRPVMPDRWRPEARIQIEDVYPQLDGGRYPVKRIEGDLFEVWTDIFRDGHDKLRAVVKYRHENGPWQEAPLEFFDNDRWVGRFALTRLGVWHYTIEAWTDRFESWREEIEKKLEAGQDISLELREGRAIVAEVAAGAKAEDANAIRRLLDEFDQGDAASRAALLLSRPVQALIARNATRPDPTTAMPELDVVVDRKAARFSAWYEMFARSQGRDPGKSATFDDCIARLPEIAGLGFDVVYLPPIHPIGRVNRKGKNNEPRAAPGDPGSPYAIGSEDGGHCAVESGLGTLDDFRSFVRTASAHGLEVALDFAVQCAPDHPWVREHPQWFRFRPDGSLRYAENPPKKYEDIVNVDFDTGDRDALWAALRDIVLFWIGQGVRIFRVDNPHTKPVPFWEWLIREVKQHCPEAIFLAEAFTRPKMMRALAKAGFSQSYTYFTWRNTKSELTEYLTELTRFPASEYFRPNFFTNTPDILPEFLQQGGRAAFRIRLVLAATLSPAYGIYNGFELCENTSLPEREEYLNSEKYEYKVWDWHRPGNIKDDIRTVNRLRRENPALQNFLSLRFLDCDEASILAYAKTSADPPNAVVVVVNLDPHAVHEGEVELPLTVLGLTDEDEFELAEGFTGTVSRLRGARQRFRLDPEITPSLIFRLSASQRA